MNPAGRIVASIGLLVCAFVAGWGVRDIQPHQAVVIHDVVHDAPSASASVRAEPPVDDIPPPPPVAPSASAPAPASAEPDKGVETPWPTSGTWVSATGGDAVPDGPAGGQIVKGGGRFLFVEHRKGSLTPYNVTFWLPRDGHMGSDTISGACGYYPSGTAFCKGYGLKGPHSTRLDISFRTEHGHVTVIIEDGKGGEMVHEELVRK